MSPKRSNIVEKGAVPSLSSDPARVHVTYDTIRLECSIFTLQHIVQLEDLMLVDEQLLSGTYI